MSSLIKRLCFVCATSIFLCQGAESASLRVSPTAANLTAPASTTTFNLRNEAQRKLNVQIRVYRWTQVNGIEQLVPTNDVVASPPMTAMVPNADYTIRVVRVSKPPVKGEESYRLVIDELPDPKAARAGTVSLVVRHVLAVFFRQAEASPPDVRWQIAHTAKGTQLVATNHGDRHLRVSEVTLGQNGKNIFSRKGLAGYVLGGGVKHWPLTSKIGASRGAISLTANSENGPYKADVAQAR